MIEIRNGYKEYVKYNEKISVLEDINIKFEKGLFYGIMGNSGAGKTTLLNILGTLDNLTKGEVIIDNEVISNLKEAEKAELRMKKIGFVFQDFYLNPNMNVRENIMQPLYINKEYDKYKRSKRVDELIKTVGLENRKEHYPKELSGGEQQRVAIARAIANNPDIILADEPTGNLDKENAKKIFEMLKQLSLNGKCVIVVSHDDIVKKYADKILILKEGKLSE